MSNLTVNVTGMLTLDRQLKLLQLSESKKRVLMFRVAKKVLLDSKKRVATQTDVDGSGFAARKKKRKKGKMESGLAKNLKVTYQSSTEARLGWGNGLMAYIAAKQQFGFSETMKPRDLAISDAKQAERNTKNNALVSRQQAVKLISLGYRKKNGQRPSIKWLTQNMHSGQAGLLIRLLRGSAGKTSWQTKLPARSFLGTTDAEAKQHINLIFDSMLEGL